LVGHIFSVLMLFLNHYDKYNPFHECTLPFKRLGSLWNVLVFERKANVLSIIVAAVSSYNSHLQH
jgi:hypothetical protein